MSFLPFTLLIILIVFLELFLCFFVRLVRKDFQWLIIKNIDENIKFESKLLEKFKKHSFDHELGWQPKPNTKGKDTINNKEINYNIGEHGQRISFNEKKLKKNQCLIFGDSYAFSRQVSDDETISSHMNKVSILDFYNFGVGNYGLDQAMLRFEKVAFKLQPKYVIFIVVPETICRIQSTWKHYFEYGNILAFKPRFIIKDDTLKLLKCPLRSISKSEVQKAIKLSQKNDFFFKKKFQKDLIFMPYIFSLFKNNFRGYKILYNYINYKLLKKNLNDWQYEFFFKVVLKNNASLTQKFFNDQNAIKLMIKMIERIETNCKKNKILPIFTLIPQMQDIEFIIETGDLYMNSFDKIMENFKNIRYINFTKSFLKDPQNYYKIYKRHHGGNHLSSFGNNYVAKRLIKEIKNHKS